MEAGRSALRKYWYIACASLRLGGAPLAVRVLDLALVVFRDGGGAARALLDRCCHRGVPLSRGRCINGALACGYHGWRYDGGGACVHIPSLTAARRIPAGCNVPAFPCVERDGYVWVWTGDGSPEPGEPPLIEEFSRWRWTQGSVPMRCAWLKGVENNLDWCHPPFAHAWTHPEFFRVWWKGQKTVSYETRTTSSGILVFTPPVADERSPVPDDALVVLQFDLPNRATVRAGSKGYQYRVVLHFVPTGESECRMEWLFTRTLRFGPRVSWTNREPRIFRQDRSLLEAAQPWYEGRADAGFERSVEADWSTLLVRRVVDLAARGLWPSAEVPGRRVVEVRS